MNYWLVKTDPDTYDFQKFMKDKSTGWDGVRNYAARNFLRQMKKGDTVLMYHSGEDKAVMGIAKVAKEFYPDPTTKEEAWVAVDLAYVSALKKPVTLAAIKAEKKLKDIALIKIGRLSVMPVTEEQYQQIMMMGS